MGEGSEGPCGTCICPSQLQPGRCGLFAEVLGTLCHGEAHTPGPGAGVAEGGGLTGAGGCADWLLLPYHSFPHFSSSYKFVWYSVSGDFSTQVLGGLSLWFPVSGLLVMEAYFLMCSVSLYCKIRFGCF